MVRASDRRRHEAQSGDHAYVLIVRGPDGRLRSERFTDAAAYRARLAALEHTTDGGLSVDEIAGLLDGAV